MTNNSDGFIVLISVVIISVLLMAVTFALSFSGFFSRFDILYAEYKEKSVSLAEACADTALLKIAQNPNYPSPSPNPVNEDISIGSDKCTIISVDTAGSQKTIKVKAIVQKSHTNLKIIANSSDLSVVSWEEMPKF